MNRGTPGTPKTPPGVQRGRVRAGSAVGRGRGAVPSAAGTMAGQGRGGSRVTGQGDRAGREGKPRATMAPTSRNNSYIQLLRAQVVGGQPVPDLWRVKASIRLAYAACSGPRDTRRRGQTLQSSTPSGTATVA